MSTTELKKSEQEDLQDFPVIFEIIIIQSLKENEKLTGELLYNETIKYKQFEEPNLSASLVKVNSKKQFVKALRVVKTRIKDEGLFPILHLEAHGGNNGIKLNNDEFVSWEELFEEIRPINILLKGVLLVNLAMCYGISIISKVDPEKRAPFGTIVGTAREVFWKDLLAAFEVFYNNYFFSFSWDEAINIVNAQNSDVKFGWLNAETVFDAITDLDRDPKHTAHLVNDLSVQAKTVNAEFKNVPIEEVRVKVESDIRALMVKTKLNRSFFLMEDLK